MHENIVYEICKYLTDREKLQFLSANKRYCSLKNKVLYDTLTFDSDIIRKLPYYNSLTRIILRKYNSNGDLFSEDDSLSDDKDFNAISNKKFIVHLPTNIKYLQFFHTDTPSNIIFVPSKITNIYVSTCYTDSFNYLESLNLEYVKCFRTWTIINKHNFSILLKCINLEKIELRGNIDDNVPFNNLLSTCHNLRKIKILYFGQELKNSLELCSNLDTIDFKHYFNQDVVDSFKSCYNLRKLILGDTFNKKIIGAFDFNYKIEIINLGSMFNMPVRGAFDHNPKLRELFFGIKFNQELTNAFDYNPLLENVSLGKFDKKLNNVFDHCPLLQKIKIESSMSHGLKYAFRLCPILKEVILLGDFNSKLVGVFDHNHILSKVILGNAFNKSLENTFNFCPLLSEIKVGKNFDKPYDHFMITHPNIIVRKNK